MSGTRFGADRGLVGGSDDSIIDGNGVFHVALHAGEMASELVQDSAMPADLGTAGAETAPVGGELSFAANVSTGFYVDSLPGESLSFAAARAAGIQLDFDTTGWEKLQYGLANLFVEAQTSVAGLDGDARSIALHDFISSNPLVPIVDGSVVIDAVARDGNTAALLQQLEAMGLTHGSAYGNIVSGYLPLDSIDDMASIATLGFARPAYTLSNAAVGQQVHAMDVDTLQIAHSGVTGTGVTVGVMSDSFNTSTSTTIHYSDDVASGDLPAGVSVLQDYAGGPGLPAPTDEGRAMAQAIYDIAPGANLMFHTAEGGMANFANGIINLVNAGADIVVDDISYLFEPVFADGIIAQAVDLVAAAGTMYFSSAGNNATSSWEGVNLKDSGVTVNWTGDPVAANDGVFHLLDFDNGPGVDFTQTILKGSGNGTFLLTWDQPWLSAGSPTGSASDLALFTLNASNQITGVFTFNNVGDDPIDGISFGAGSGTVRIAIGVRDGNPMPGLVKWYSFGSTFTAQEYATNSGTAFGHSNAAGAVSVGASFWATTNEWGFNHITGQNYPYAESFTSKGGVPILFDDSGNRLAQPEFRSTVDITASDGADTTFFGQALGGDGTPQFPNFFGTSQAAPNAAAVAALLMQAFPTATNAQIEAAMKMSARDINITSSGSTIVAFTGAGLDLTTGNGLIDANGAYNAMATVMANSAPVIGITDQSAAVTELTTPVGNLTDTGIIQFSDADGAQAHIVSNGFAVGGVLGSLNATILTDTAVDGSGGQVQWTYTVAASAAEYLAAGETKVDTFALVLDDQHGSQQTLYVTATVTGTEDAPIVSLVSSDSAAKSVTETNAALSSSGTLTTTDADYSNTVTPSVQSVAATGTTAGLTSDSVAQKGWMTVSPGTITANLGEAHNLGWSFNSGGEAFNYLAAGESLVLTYTLQATDSNAIPGSATQTVAITINGTNDAPLITVTGSDSAAASIAETNATLATAGTLSVVDPDSSDSVTASIVSVTAGGVTAGLASNNAALKAMLALTPTALTADPGSAHNLTWSFNSAGEAFNYLDEGESLTLTYVVRATDTHGVTADQNVTVTINGTNDGPSIDVVSPSDSSGASFTDGGNALAAHGTLTATDADLSDSVTTSIGSVSITSSVSVPNGPEINGMLKVTPPGLAADPSTLANLNWSFAATPSAFDFLAAGEHVTIDYGIRVTDDSGATATKIVSVVVNGANEAPAISGSLPASTAVVELPDGSAGENSAVLVGNGTIHFSDSDRSDTHSAGFVANGSGYLGNFMLGPVNDATGSVGWVFAASDGVLNGLAAGQVVHQDYTVTVSDGHGGTSDVVIGVDLIGSNDAAILSSANVVVTQNVLPVTANGTLTISDEDGAAAFQAIGNVHGSYGSLSLAANGDWSYVADNALLNIAAGQVVTDSFTVFAADGTPTTIAVSIAGSNDIAIAQTDHFTTDEATTLGGLSLFDDHGNGADSDPDGPPLSISAVNGDAAFVGHQIHLASGALLTVNGNGTFSYDPNHAFDALTLASGAVNQSAFDSFTYTLAGGTTATVLVDVTGLDSAQDQLDGSGGDNAITGSAGGDTFLLQQGGSDTAYGQGGNDGFYFGGALDHGDTVDGGDGTDTIALQGNTNASLGDISGVEVLVALSGSDTSYGDTAGNHYSYDLTSNDGNVAAGQTLTVIGTGLLPGENMRFDGSAESDGNFRIFAGQGVDDLTGGGGSDGFFFGANGNLTGADHVDGGAGVDTLALRGNYAGANAVVFGDGSLANVEVVAMFSGHATDFGGQVDPAGFDYDLTMANGNVAAGQHLDIVASGLAADESLRFDGRSETDGSYRIFSGAGDDRLWGGSGNDLLYGGLGADRLEGGAGADTYIYASAAESTGVHYDTIVGFDWHVDHIDTPGGARAFTQSAGGALSTASFDADLSTGLGGTLGANGAALFTASSGTLAGHLFAVIDGNGVAGYQAGADFVIELVTPVTPIPHDALVIA